MRSLVAWICSAAVLLAGPAWSCSPPMGEVPELTKAQSAHFADTILVGKILETYEDGRHLGDDVYWATMKIYCIYKGEVSTGVINITEVGIIPGLCHSTSLQKGSEYIVYLRKQRNEISDVEIENTEQHRLDVSKACGLHLRYPEGISKEDLPHSCPEPASDDECTPRYVPDTDQAPPAPPGHEDHDHDHDSHGHDSHGHEGHGHEGHGHEGHGHDGFDHDGHDHVGHTHEEHDQHDEEDKKEHAEHDDEHDHDGHDHDGHDHEGHSHDDFDHDGHAHEGHTHEEHDTHDEEHEHEHDGEHDHEHDDHEHDDHGHGGHDDDAHDHDEYDHKGHEHKGHTHEEHDKHDQHHEDEHEHTVKAGAAHGSDRSSSSRGSCAIGVLLLALGIGLSL